MAADTPAFATDPETGNPVYGFKPALMGAPWQFELAADALAWRLGPRSGRIPYGSITRVRLSFRPLTMQSYRFLTEIWSASGPKLQIASTSWKSIVEHERLDAAYAAFVAELNRRIAAAGGPAVFERGSPALIYWPGLLVVVGASLALAALVVRALQVGQWAGAAFIAAFLALFVWHAGNFMGRNRPGRYRPDTLPPDLLPGRWLPF